MIVSMWMTRNPLVVTESVSIAVAANLMATRRIRRLPVVELDVARPTVVGIISSTDILHAYAPDVNPFGTRPEAGARGYVVGDVMTRHPLSTTPETPIEEVAKVLRDKKIGALPVVQGSGLVGIITESDIFRAFISVMGADRGGVRLTFDLSKDEDALNFLTSLARRFNVRIASLMTSSYEGKDLGVLRVHGDNLEPFVDSLWDSGHRVLSVLDQRQEPKKEGPKEPKKELKR